MLAKSDVARIYETVLSIPGMSENVKLNITIARKDMLLLSKIIERGLNGNNSSDKSIGILDAITQESTQVISTLTAELLAKAGLSEMNEKLKLL